MEFFGQKVIFSISDVPQWFNESISRFPAIFNKISENQIFDLSRVQTSHRANISIANFKTCSNYLNMGGVYSVLMPVVTLQSFVTIGLLKVG